MGSRRIERIEGSAKAVPGGDADVETPKRLERLASFGRFKNFGRLRLLKSQSVFMLKGLRPPVLIRSPIFMSKF
jgi:hypothetical protein